MGFAVVLESLKFYKLKHENTVRLWFVLLYALNIIIYFLPFVDMDFSDFYYFLNDFMADGHTTLTLTDVVSAGNYAFIGLNLLMSLINAFFGLMYATLYIGEYKGLSVGESTRRSLAAAPRIILLGLLLLVPALLSAYLLFVPVIVFALMMYFMPLTLALEKQKLAEAMNSSYQSTRGKKVFIFLQAVLLSMIISIPRNLILRIVPLDLIPTAIVATFFTVLQTFMQARLMGFLYVLLVIKDQSVLPSKPNQENK